MKKTIKKITKTTLMLETLESRGSDDLDFHEFSVWQVQKALEEAFKAGQAQAEKKLTKKQNKGA